MPNVIKDSLERLRQNIILIAESLHHPRACDSTLLVSNKSSLEESLPGNTCSLSYLLYGSLAMSLLQQIVSRIFLHMQDMYIICKTLQEYVLLHDDDSLHCEVNHMLLFPHLLFSRAFRRKGWESQYLPVSTSRDFVSDRLFSQDYFTTTS